MILPCTPNPPVYSGALHNCVLYIYIYIWQYGHTNCLTTPSNPSLYDRSLHATYPAPQIISRPVASVTAVTLPSNCTSKFTNPILTDCDTFRRVCDCLNGCDVCQYSLWGFGVQEITFSNTAVYFTDRAKCRPVLRFTQAQTRTGCGILV
jgi:hypothetical protein